MSWCAREFREVNFGDQRLNKRFLSVAQSIYDNPGQSIAEASNRWGSAKATYRMFENQKIDPKIFLRAHQNETQKRCLNHEVVLAIQDSTFLNYDSFKSIEGLGSIEGSNKWSFKGLIFHPSIAFSTEGDCLGLLNYQLFSRPEKHRRHHHEHDTIPISEKETFIWLKTLKENANLTTKRRQIVTIGDRESDIFELFQTATNLNTFFLIRSSKKRYIYNHEIPSEKAGTIADESIEKEKSAVFKLNIPANNGQKARTASIEVSYYHTTLKPPPRRGRSELFKLEPQDVWVVSAVEINPPTGTKAINWVLLTNFPVNSIDEACEKVSWYKIRWQIEVYFKVLKSGFNIEKARLNHVEKLEKYLLLTAILATRVMALSFQAKTKDDKPSNKYFSKLELSVLFALKGKGNRSIGDIELATPAIILLAQMGGYLNRKNDGPPGTITIWRGINKLHQACKVVEKLSKLMGKS